MHRRRTGGAGVLDARSRLEAQLRVGLQHQRGRKILRREAGVEMAEHDLVDVCGGNAGIGQRIGRNLDHEALDGFRVELAEWRVRPSDDAGCHGRSPCFGSGRFVTYLGCRFQRFHRPRAHGGYAGPVAGPDIRRRAEPGTAHRHDIRLGQPGRRIGFPDAAGRANPNIGKRPRQRPQCLDTAGLLGREEFYQIEARRQRLHQFGSRRDPRREWQVALGGGFQQIRRRARADAEFGAERPRPREIVGVQDRPDADNGFRHLRDHGLGGLDGHRRSQRDFQHADAAGDQRPRQRHRVFQPLDGQHRNDRGGLEDGGELFLPVLAAVMGMPCEK